MTDRDDLVDRLDAVEGSLGHSPPLSPVVYTDGDRYATADGDAVPLDPDGDPAPEGAGPTVILDVRYTDTDPWGDS